MAHSTGRSEFTVLLFNGHPTVGRLDTKLFNSADGMKVISCLAAASQHYPAQKQTLGLMSFIRKSLTPCKPSTSSPMAYSMSWSFGCG